MALVNMKEMLTAARKAKKAVGAFNITNYETAAAVLKAAEAENEPVIIQLYMRLFDTGKAYDLCGLLQRCAAAVDDGNVVPFARKLFGQRAADLSVADDDDLHFPNPPKTDTHTIFALDR